MWGCDARPGAHHGTRSPLLGSRSGTGNRGLAPVESVGVVHVHNVSGPAGCGVVSSPYSWSMSSQQNIVTVHWQGNQKQQLKDTKSTKTVCLCAPHETSTQLLDDDNDARTKNRYHTSAVMGSRRCSILPKVASVWAQLSTSLSESSDSSLSFEETREGPE
mmetsp:Transcript_18477/g.42770  ORF Transcript_18477/g.42770 Transcript_18477/m.42770 type:complete len:161 (-) Transcript_18477:1025-1507(-)